MAVVSTYRHRHTASRRQLSTERLGHGAQAKAAKREGCQLISLYQQPIHRLIAPILGNGPISKANA